MKRYLSIVTFISCLHLHAQTPKLRGTLHVSVENGTLAGEFTLTGIPPLEDHAVTLNAGLNVAYFKDANGSVLPYGRTYNSDVSYESFLYTFPKAKMDSSFSMGSITVKYTGQFPVHLDSTELRIGGDWKGNIAFVDHTLRMDGYQTSWYPILYDLTTDKRYSLMSHSIKVTCRDCSALYLNGSEPMHGQEHTFTSAEAVEASLFVGNYEFHKISRTWFLNPDIDELGMNTFAALTETFQSYFTEKTGIPYQQTIRYIQTTPTSRDDSFLFIDYPSIVNVGRGTENGLASMINEEYLEDKSFIAHELAHYYFGAGPKRFNSVIEAPICEGFSEYMSLKATEDLIDVEVYQSLVDQIISELKDHPALNPILRIKQKADLGHSNTYSYIYFPAILLALESELGKETMWKWIQTIQKSESENTDHAFLRATLIEAIADPHVSERIIEKYLTSEHSLDQALERLKSN